MHKSVSCLWVVYVLSMVGCGSSSSGAANAAAGTSSTSSASGGVATGGSSACSAGSERCDCYGNGTCNQGLICLSNLCVVASVGGNTSVGGNAGGGAPGGGQASSGGADNGGTNGVGGTLGAGGGDIGGAPGGGQASSGGTENGTAAGGTGSNATGGLVGVGGTGVAGGVSTSGAPTTGGVQTNGGTHMGGSAATSGGSSAGQPSTGGSPSLCGNGVLDPGEGCDFTPSNNDLGDGCTPDCMAEPNCPAAGGPCTSHCGDGLVLGSEGCDDGNTKDGDGCASDCSVEPGYTCAQPALGDTMVVPMVVRDFNTGADFEKGSGFSTGLYYANQGLLQSTLDVNGLKPVLVSTTGTFDGKADTASGIASPESFAQWYNDAAQGPNTYHGTMATSLRLFLNADSSAYVNRFGTNGDGANSAQYLRTNSYFCGTVGLEDHDANGTPIPCTTCIVDEDPQTPQCDPPHPTDCQTDSSYVRCEKTGSTYYGQFLVSAYDGNPLFFPADPIKPYSPSATGQIGGNYNPSWPSDPTGAMHNFSFTTEVRFWFLYDSSKTYKLKFVGDDDIWIFVNKKLAVDMGGIHTAVSADLTLESAGATTVTIKSTYSTTATPITTHPDLGLQSGNVYEIAIFQAERQTKASSYMISLPGFNTARSVCTKEPQ